MVRQVGRSLFLADHYARSQGAGQHFQNFGDSYLRPNAWICSDDIWYDDTYGEDSISKGSATPPVMWSETIGLRTTPVWDQKKIGLGLARFCTLWSRQLSACVETAGLLTRQTVILFCDYFISPPSVLQVWCCVVKHGLVTLVVIVILKDTATFKVLVCAWNITTVEINSDVHLLKS